MKINKPAGHYDVGKKKKYISPSQVNSFIDYRDDYIRKYILGHPWGSNNSFARGTAVEAGLVLAIGCETGAPMENSEACEKAYEIYLKECSDNNVNPDKFDHDHIVGMTMAACLHYKSELGATPAVKTQVKANYEMEGLDLPFFGYMDFVFPGKTTPFATSGWR